MKKTAALVFLIGLIFSSAGVFSAESQQAPAASSDNPFFKPYGTPFNVPPFALIKNEHFLPALEEGSRREQAESAAPTIKTRRIMRFFILTASFRLHQLPFAKRAFLRP